ncbi:MAG TPA: aspartate--tRNA(Asn) ligase, partial [Pyrodictium sp.]|nr:aspartate--tRNA(Asn) ligase [Pyrodictium sp.]
MAISLRSRIHVAELLSKGEIGKEYTVAGWVDTVRAHGGIVFVVLRDRTGKIQLVVKKNVSKSAWKTAKNLTPESVIAAYGTLAESKAALGGRELVVSELVVYSKADPL